MLDDIKIKTEKPFFVTFIGRSGSTHLQHLLNQHPDLFCDAEIFNPRLIDHGFKEKRIKRFATLVKMLMGRKWTIRYKVKSVYAKTSPAARGFEYKIDKDYVHCPEVYEWLVSNKDKIKCVFLRRRNNLRSAVSLQNFKKVKQIYKTANINNNTKHEDMLDVDIDAVITETRRRETLNAEYLEKMKRDFDVHEIFYEDLVSQELEILNGIFRFLGIAEVHEKNAFTHMTNQISQGRMSDYIANYDDLTARLKEENMYNYIEMDNEAA